MYTWNRNPRAKIKIANIGSLLYFKGVLLCAEKFVYTCIEQMLDLLAEFIQLKNSTNKKFG